MQKSLRCSSSEETYLVLEHSHGQHKRITSSTKEKEKNQMHHVRAQYINKQTEITVMQF